MTFKIKRKLNNTGPMSISRPMFKCKWC